MAPVGRNIRTVARGGTKATEPLVYRRRFCLDCGHRWTTYEIRSDEFDLWCKQVVTARKLSAEMRRLQQQLNNAFPNQP